MYLLRLQAIISGQPQINKQVAVYYADGNTPAVLYNPTNETPIGNQLKTDASGFISFKIVSLTTLTFRTLTGLTLSPAAYALYSGVATPPPQINPIPVANWEDIVLTPLMVANKAIVLEFEPIPESLEVTTYYGLIQERNVDYQLIGQTISWNSLALELLLQSGDKLRVSYCREA
jgi:hypothetical protein